MLLLPFLLAVVSNISTSLTYTLRRKQLRSSYPQPCLCIPFARAARKVPWSARHPHALSQACVPLARAVTWATISQWAASNRRWD